MQTQRRVLRFWIGHSFWFVPSAITLLAALGATGALYIDRLVAVNGPWILSHAGERSTLEVIATSMITVAGVVFSMTLVALSTWHGAGQ